MPLFSGRTILGVVAVMALILGGFVLRDVEYPGVGDVPWVGDACDDGSADRKALLEASDQHMRRINDLQKQAAMALVAGRPADAQTRLDDVAREAETLARDLGAVNVVVEKRGQRDRSATAARGIATAARAVGGQAAALTAAEFATAAAPLDDASAAYNAAMQTLVDTSAGCD